MNRGSRLDVSALDTLLAAVLERNPHGVVFAIDDQGLFTQMPETFPVGERYLLRGAHATALDLAAKDDARGIIEAWTEARLRGCGRVSVHLANDPARSVVLHYIDAMHTFGIYVGLFEMEADATSVDALNEAPPLKPRVGIVRKNEMAFVLEIDQATTQLLGWSSEELVGTRSLEFLDPEDHPQAISNWIEMLRSPGARRRQRLRHKHRDGSWVWLEITNYNLLADPEHGYVLTEMLDISDEMRAQDALRAREHLIRRLADALPQGLFQIDPHGQVVYRNERLAAIFGATTLESADDVLAAIHSESTAAMRAALDAALLAGSDADLEIAIHPAAQDARRCDVNIRALTDDAGAVTGAIVCVTDVTESVRMRRELEERATFDVLTQTRNRASVLNALELTLAGPVEGGTAVIFIDLDRFKVVNDRFGHAAGDAYLVEVARRLQAGVRDSDVIGRIGGDEFLVVCRDVESGAAALELGRRMQAHLEAAPITLGGRPVRPGASMGVVWSPAGAHINADTLVARADQAMYASKRAGRAQPVLFSKAA